MKKTIKKLYLRERNYLIACDACGGVIMDSTTTPRQISSHYESWKYDEKHCYDEQVGDLHYCTACFEEAMEYIRGKKEAQRNNQTYPEAPKGKKLHSPRGNYTW
jgi:hypothetical protein